jgi:glycerol-3-phosphate dehydrogenase (NAD(P)+)
MKTSNINIGLLGSGSWGTALIKILTEHKIANPDKIGSLKWWMRNEDTVAHIQNHRHNPNYISSVELHPNLMEITTDLEHVIRHSDFIVLAIPSAFLHETLNNTPRELFKGKYLVSAIKGLLPHSRQIVADYMMHTFDVAHEQMLVISGPCHAEEVAAEKLSYLTIAGLNESATHTFSQLLSCRFIKTIESRDISGTEYGAVLKNIYAVASGICQGLGFGDNFQAVLISNAIREMEAFLYAIHAHPREINHSAYLGDLLVTAYSQHSRNRRFGLMLGKGYSVKAAQLEMNMIAEGYYACKSMFELNQSQLKVEMPIAETVYNIIYQNKNARAEVDKLCAKLV